MNIQVCRDTADAVALYLPQRLYLKSFAKLNISVQLPSLKVHGKAISNWELMEKLRKMILPEVFSILKVSKNTTEVIRFDAELENRSKLERVLCRLDDRVIQLNDYPEALRVRVSEAKSDFPSRHCWDSFFRDATDMDEMKPGERPDTMHISNLPIRWFINSRDKDEDAMPSESLFKKVFEKFGNIRQVDVPAADPFRMQMKAAMRGITVPPQDSALYFEGYIQFSEYLGFVRCMDALRGRKLLRKQDDVAEWCGIHVDFDKTKHMTDAAVKRRSIVRERLLTRQRAKEHEEQQEKEKIAKRELKERQKQERAEREKLEKMREREERRKKKQLAKLMAKDGVDINSHVAEEEKKLLKAQRKLQSIRLIEELFKRIELRRDSERGVDAKRSSDASARERLVLKYKREQETRVERQRERLRRASDGRIVIRSALETKKHRPRASSISSISSEEEHKQKKIKIEKSGHGGETDYSKAAAAGVFGLPAAYGYGYAFPAPHPAYPYQQNMYYPIRGAFYSPPSDYVPRARGYGRRGRGRPPHRGHAHAPRLPNLEDYYRFVKKFDGDGRNDHDDRDHDRGRERSRSRSRRRSYTRSRSRSRSRSRRRSRSRSRRRSYSRSRSHSRTRRSRSRSRRSRSRRSRSHASRSRSRSRGKGSRSRSRRRSKSRSRSKKRDGSKERRASVDSSKFVSPNRNRKERSKSWSMPKEGERGWSKSPKKG